MRKLSRLALGTIQPGADPTALLWALMAAFERTGLRVQSFLSRAHFSPRDGATVITGLSPRHLDSWLMPEPLCREIFVRGCRSTDMAIVEGSFIDAASADISGGNLNTLCGWLDLPRLAIVDARLLRACRLPERPGSVDGLLLDRCHDVGEFYRLQTLFESLWKIPVLGWLGKLTELRDSIAEIEPGSQPSLDLCQALGDQFTRHTRLDRLCRLAERPIPKAWPSLVPFRAPRQTLRVAVAYDEAFHYYFPDTLDLLELRGATICEFSPLSDDRLPPDVDIVYFGCGRPDRFAAELSENDCMMLALKSHLCSGKRMYAECGGLAYLCQQIVMPDGQCWPMVGALQATAHVNDRPGAPHAKEIAFASDTWLARRGVRCRGYLNARWNIVPTAGSDSAEKGPDFGIVTRHQAIGSRIHLDFAAQEHLLDRFFAPHATSCDQTIARVGRSF